MTDDLGFGLGFVVGVLFVGIISIGGCCVVEDGNQRKYQLLQQQAVDRNYAEWVTTVNKYGNIFTDWHWKETKK